MFADVLWAREFNKHSYDIIIIITFMIIDNLNYASSSGFLSQIFVYVRY